MQKIRPRITIIMSTYNRKKDLLECLRSVFDNNYPNLKIILVDNGCIDGTKQAVRERFPEIKVIRTEKNLGAVGGINLGIKNAPRNSDYLLFLDDDYVLTKNAISQLLRSIQNKKEYGAATAKVLYFENKNIVQSAGSSVGLFTGINYMNTGYDNGKFDKIKDTEGIGGTGLVKIEVVKKVGLWDETFYYYYEDPDFSMRIIKAGYKIRYVPTSKIYHKLPLISNNEAKKRWFARAYWVARNKIIFMRKHSRCFPLFTLLYPCWLFIYTYQAIRYLNFSALINFYKGMADGYKWAVFNYENKY